MTAGHGEGHAFTADCEMIEFKGGEGGCRGVVVRPEDSIRLSAVGTEASMCVFTGDECCGGTKV